jgi:long-chain fatty acid transport protein
MSTPVYLSRGGAFGAALCAGMMLSTSVFAGAFAVREQSAYFQGMSFAGAAAGHELSSMFWNSAAAAAAPGINTESHIALVVPHTEIDVFGGTLTGGGADLSGSGKIGNPTLVPASYANYQLSERLFLGIATNAQYGFTTKPDNTGYAGAPLGVTSEVFSINLNPTMAYKLDDTLTVGVGIQVQYIDIRLRSAQTDLGLVPGVPGRTTEGDDIGFGVTAGVIWQPVAGTSIGLGYRSAIKVGLKGTCTGTGLSNVALGGCDPAGESASVNFILPELVSLGLRQQITEELTILGTIEWTNWSRLGTPQIRDSSGATIDSLALEYKDGWFYSVGLEYAMSPGTTLRTGLGYERSPIRDDTRNVILPDNDRIWLSAGATFQLFENTAIDVGYTHLFVKDAPICQPQPSCSAFDGESTGDIDIFTVGVKTNWGGAQQELESLK